MVGSTSFYPPYLDPGKEVASLFKVLAMPSSYLLDHRGVIRYVHLGYSEKDVAKWGKEVETLRGNLADPIMQFDYKENEFSVREHMLEAQ